MKRPNTVYYLLFVLIVFGAFASMAQNDYGLDILGLVAFLFAIIFAIQLVDELLSRRASINLWSIAESLGLVIISAILAMRVYYIRFPFVEVMFAAGGALLGAAYVRKAFTSYSRLQKSNLIMAAAVAVLFLSLLLYLASMVTVPFAPALAEPMGMAAFGLLIIFIIINLIKRDFMVEGERISPFSYIVRLKDRTVLLISLFLAFTLYMGLTSIDFLPKMYSDQFPQAYYELVNKAESGQEEPVNGTFKHEEFKKRYDEFIKNNKSSDKK